MQEVYDSEVTSAHLRESLKHFKPYSKIVHFQEMYFQACLHSYTINFHLN